MRISTMLTAGAGAALSLPTLCWALGAGPQATVVLHTTTVVVATALFYLTGRLGDYSQRDALWTGGFAGFIGSASAQFLIHASAVTAPLGTAFTSYGPFGPALYRMDNLSPWWPYAWILWSTAVYALWGAAVWSWAKRRQKVLAH